MFYGHQACKVGFIVTTVGLTITKALDKIKASNLRRYITKVGFSDTKVDFTHTNNYYYQDQLTILTFPCRVTCSRTLKLR